MNNQKLNHIIQSLSLSFCLLIFLIGSEKANAQADIWDGLAYMNYGTETVDLINKGKVAGIIKDDGVAYKVPYKGNKFDLILPKTITHQYLMITVRGGDGGTRPNPDVNGGGGATMTAYYRIGDAENQISEEDRLRFIIGNKGRGAGGDGNNGAFGGSGSGVFLKKGLSGNNWKTLLVAGGGGGAYADCCTIKSTGRSASIKPNGTDGRGSSVGKGGTDGGDGTKPGGITTQPGSGVNSAWEDGVPVGNSDDIIKKDPQLGAGGTGASTENSGYSIGKSFGAGHGGADLIPNSGCGGGGYSGGGAGGYSGGGGGGGSYYGLNMDIAYFNAAINGTTFSPQNGYAIFQFTDNLPSNLPALPNMKLSSAPNKCIHVESQDLDHGNNMELFDCIPYATTQSWTFVGYEIKLNYDKNKCINVDGGSTDNGSNIRIKNCNNTNAQKWIYDGLSKQLRSKLNYEKCLDVAFNGRTTNGTNIQLYDCKPASGGGAGQQWTIAGTSTVRNPTAIQYIVPDKYSNRALQSINGAKSGSNMQIGAKSSTNNSIRFVFNDMQIQYGPSKDLCLGLANNSTANGTNIQLMGSASDKNTRKWIYDGQTKQIRSLANPNKCIEVETTGRYDIGSNLKLMDCSDKRRQQFNIVEQ